MMAYTPVIIALGGKSRVPRVPVQPGLHRLYSLKKAHVHMAYAKYMTIYT